jgi:hypothetical protein
MSTRVMMHAGVPTHDCNIHLHVTCACDDQCVCCLWHQRNAPAVAHMDGQQPCSSCLLFIFWVCTRVNVRQVSISHIVCSRFAAILQAWVLIFTSSSEVVQQNSQEQIEHYVVAYDDDKQEVDGGPWAGATHSIIHDLVPVLPCTASRIMVPTPKATTNNLTASNAGHDA